MWVHATSLLKPMLMMGKDAIDAPITSSLPGTVRWASKKRLVVVHGKCGLPSSRPRPLAVAALPKAQPLLPMGGSSSWRSRLTASTSIAATSSLSDKAAAALPAAGGAAARMPAASAPALAWMLFSSARRAMSSAVTGRTHAALRHAAGRCAGGVSRR
ncbi:hypothetical protein D3C81_1579970 [compost metagenome]